MLVLTTVITVVLAYFIISFFVVKKDETFSRTFMRGFAVLFLFVALVISKAVKRPTEVYARSPSTFIYIAVISISIIAVAILVLKTKQNDYDEVELT